MKKAEFDGLVESVKEMGEVLRGESTPAAITVFLPEEEAEEARGAKPEALPLLAMGARVCYEDQTLELRMADRSIQKGPLSVIRPSGTHEPDFSKPRLTDWGQTVGFGEYEASVDAILRDWSRLKPGS